MTTPAVNQNPRIEEVERMRLAGTPRVAEDTPSVAVLLTRYHQLRLKYSGRNMFYRDLLNLYDNDPCAHGMTGQMDQTELIVNRFFDSVNTFVDFLGMTPNMNFTPPDLTPAGTDYAEHHEKYLYALWDVNKMELLWPKVTFDQSLLGTGYMGVLPTREFLDKGFVRYRRFRPEYFYPQMDTESGDIRHYFYHQPYTRVQAIAEFGEDVLAGAGTSGAWKNIWPDGSLDPDEIPVLEYADDEWLIIMVMDKIVEAVHHKFGWCPAVVFPGLVRPDIVGGVSSVAHYKSLQIYESELFSLIGDILAYWADPMLFIKSDRLSLEDVHMGGVTVGGPQDDAKFIVPQMQTELIGAQVDRTREIFHDGTVPETIYGRLKVKGALGSAPALTGLQMKFMMKLNGYYRRNGRALQDLNSMALKIGKKLFTKTTIKHAGYAKNRYYHLDIHGKDLGEFTAHQVLWDARVIDPDRHATTEMQKRNNGLQSKYTTIEKLGGVAVDEFERMRQEDIYDVHLEAAKQALGAQLSARMQGGAGPVDQVARDDRALTKGRTQPLPGQGSPGRPRAVGSSSAAGAAPAPPRLDSDAIVQSLGSVKKLKGEVYVVDIGETIDIAITDKLDKQTLLNSPAMTALKGQLVFIVIQPGEAREGWRRVN